ncbi:MAG: gamma-glutamylcyclotransferase family protein [Ferrovibrio sp.]
MVFAKFRSLHYTVLYVSTGNLDQFRDPSRLPAMVYFFYGTLCDPDVQRLILGYRPGPRQIRPARLPGFRRKRARGRSYPVLLRAAGHQVAGLVFRPARPTDTSRLAAYEGPEYIIRRLPVRIGANGSAASRARVFLPARTDRKAPLVATFEDWHLQRWQQHEKTAFLRSLQT